MQQKAPIQLLPKQKFSWNTQEKSPFHAKQQILKMSEAKAEKCTTWGDNGVITLIEIWAGEGIQEQLDSFARKWPINDKIARRLPGGGR